MISRLKGYGLIKGARGKEGASIKLFAEIIVRVSSLPAEAPEIMELDINPLIGRGEKIKSADCRILLDRTGLVQV